MKSSHADTCGCRIVGVLAILSCVHVASKSNRTHVQEPSDCKEEQVAGDESGDDDVDEAFEALRQEGRHLRVPRRPGVRVAGAPAGKSSF